MNSAILFLTYRRFKTAEKVFESIRKAQPPKLYFASNAPNPENEGEIQRVLEVRALIERIDWPCKLYTLFRDEHLSVKYSIPSAIDWFFETEEMGIILEDDCLPSQSFYAFCDELLKRYQNESSVMMISGNNFQNGIKRGDNSYYFSKHCHIWGWATWKDRWSKYDLAMTDWPYHKSNALIGSVFYGFVQKLYWNIILDRVYKGEIETWDYQWNFACWKNNGLSCTPMFNQVSNIGFGSDSTFTKDESSNASNISRFEIEREIVHPKYLYQNYAADLYTFRNHYLTPSRLIKYMFKKIMKIILHPFKYLKG